MAPCPGVGESTTTSHTAGTGTSPPGTAPPGLNLPRARRQGEGEGWGTEEQTEEQPSKPTRPPQAAPLPVPLSQPPACQEAINCPASFGTPPALLGSLAPRQSHHLLAAAPCPAANTLTTHPHPRPPPPKTGPVCAHRSAGPAGRAGTRTPCAPSERPARSARHPAVVQHSRTLTHTRARSQPPLRTDPPGAPRDPLALAGQPCQAASSPAGYTNRLPSAHAPLAHTHKPHGLTPVLAGARAPLQEEALASRCLFPPLTPSLDLDPARGPAGTHPTAPRPRPREEDGDEDEESGALALLLQGLAAGTCPGLGDRRHRWGTRLTDATHWGLAPMSPCKAGASRAR